MHAPTEPVAPDADAAALRDTHWSTAQAGTDDAAAAAAHEAALESLDARSEGERSWWGGRRRAYGPRFDCRHELRIAPPEPVPGAP